MAYGIYWLAVVLIVVVGTLVGDNLVERRRHPADDDDRLQRDPDLRFRIPVRCRRTISVHTLFTTTP